MQNQITNQLLLFGIYSHEYTVSTHPTGETEITVAGHTVAVIPAVGRKLIQLDHQWTLDRIPSDSLVLAVSAVIAALLRCRRPVEQSAPHSLLGSLPALPISPPSGAMVDKTPPPCGGEAATIPRLGIYPTDNHSPESYE